MNSTNSFNLSAVTDAELIQRCGQGDQIAYGQIVERYQSLVCSVAYNRCGDLALSEDLAQEAFILAWQKLVDLKDVSKFKAWICTIVRNLANRSAQGKGREVTRTAHLDAVPDIPAEIPSPVERAVSAEEEKLVWQALADVPESYREPLILFYREGQSVARVAAALDLSQDAVKQRLSRGRKLLRLQLASVVETVLVNSKPSKAFRGAVLLGLSGATAPSATAAGFTTATVAKSAAGIGAGNGLSSLFLAPLLNLPVIAWLLKLSFHETRSEQERQLLHRSYFIAFCGFVVFLIALGSSFWWQQSVEPPVLRALIPAVLMGLFGFPWTIYCRRMGKQIEAIRAEEGTATPLRPLVVADHGEAIAVKTYVRFCLSALTVMAVPALLPLVARDWLVFVAMFIAANSVGFAAAQLSLRFPKRSFQFFGMSNGVTALTAIGILFWRQGVWASAFADFMLWFVGAITAVNLVSVFLTTIAWQRVYGKPGDD
ncbi:sigma-70 family RNA polymerase sigma factor [uncultured Gimesia sp.]|jgi:RNA polymerase sigma factor (sigma-70 family)|uniref:RNA polymerase sigma factor n=1 Tax=uncultured Gimesia sp. TaxID=1678688 RepID=UPI00261F4006|nr:sigma-70 family RNA polymerase sigma factor [uncultured Gimesia sp.]